MINLYAENETNFTKNGLATLQPLSATFAPNINGAWSLTLVLPYDNTDKYKYIEKNCKIRCDLGCIREQSISQVFRIYDIKKNLTTLTVMAHPIGMEAQFDAPIEELKIPSEPGVMTASGHDIAAVLNDYIKTHDDNDKYTISSNISAQTFVQWEDTNAIAAISGSDEGSFVNKLGGEVLYDNLNITIKDHIGNNNSHHPVVYGRNLTGMEHDLDMSSVVTRAYPKSTDGLRLHQYDDVNIDYWYGTFENGERKNYAKSQYLYSYDFHTWYYFGADGKLSTEPIPAETIALLNTYDWHEDETGWYYGDGVSGSGNYIANAWVEHSDGKHYWMDAQGYMDSTYTDSEVWTWNQVDSSGESYGEKRLSFVDSPHINDYPYVRSAFLAAPYQLLDTDSNSNSITAKNTSIWTQTLYDTIYNAASEVWDNILKDLTNTYCPQYIQDIILGDNSIVEYTQARYAYSHKGWQSLLKSLIKEAVEWIEDVELVADHWIHLDGYWYGNTNADGSRHNYARNQYIYAYSESKWYWFDADGIMSTEEIPQETIDLLNTYDWHTDEHGEYYGDGQGNYMTSAWIESSNGNHSWVNAEGYYEPEWDDTTAWSWTDIDGYQYGRSSQQFAKSEYVVINKQLEYFGSDGFWHDWERVAEEDMGWYLDQTLNKWWYGSKKRYFAHNEFVYMTVDGTLEEWWYDEEGWYDADSSGETSFGWHGDSTTGYWFGEEDAESGDKNKYIHDKWAFIDGTYYWFDSDGYISADATKAKQNFAWGDLVDEVTGKHWFGNENEDFNRMWLSNQWLKIDGEWYYFDSDGYMVDTNTKHSQMVTYVSNAIVSALTPVASALLKEAYDLLYNLMTNWVLEQYANELDLPTITVTVNLVDLSKTTEYADYQDLEKICLGDGVDCIDYVHDMSISARVVGLNYDILRGVNTSVTLGKIAKAMVQIVTPTTTGASNNTMMIAGDGLKIDGQVISSEGSTGASYGVQDVTYKGVSKVNNNVAILDELGIEHIDLDHEAYEELPDSKTSDDKFYFITDEGIILHNGVAYGDSRNITYGLGEPSGGEDGDLYFKIDAEGNIKGIYQNHEGVWGAFAGAGLQFWTETSDQFYRAYEVEGMSADDGYIFTNPDDWYCWYGSQGGVYFGAFEFRKKDNNPAIIVAVGTNTDVTRFYLISTIESATKWEYKSLYITMDWTDPTGGSDTDSTRGAVTGSVTDNHGTTWYYSRGLFGSAYRSPRPEYDFNGIEGSPWTKSDDEWVEQILGISHASPTTTVKVGLGKDDKILYQKVGENYVAYLDDTGAFEGTDYKVNGESLITKINAKQDKLIAGQNITIGADGKTISATDTNTDAINDMTDVDLDDLSDGQVLKWDATNEKWVNDDESGGSEVIANPSETATDTLSKVSIDGTVYEIEGSSGEGYTEDVLWNTGGTTSSWASPLIITLSENISDYDAIRISFTDVDGNDGFVFIPTSEIPSNYADKYFVGAGDFLATVKVNSNTQISCYAKNGITMTYNNVIGISYGSGGGGGYSETELWADANGQTFSSQSTYTANLDGEITEYDMLEIEFAPSTDPTWHHHSLVPVNQIDTTGTNGFMCTIAGGNAGYTPFVQYIDADTLSFSTWGRAYSVVVYKIIGIKFGGGSGGGSSEINYSTEEQRIGTWIDGSDLYQITYSYTSAVTSIDISSLNVNEVIELSGAYLSGSSWVPITRTSDSLNYQSAIWASSTTLEIWFGSRVPNVSKLYVTIKYTKNTD